MQGLFLSCVSSAGLEPIEKPGWRGGGVAGFGPLARAGWNRPFDDSPESRSGRRSASSRLIVSRPTLGVVSLEMKLRAVATAADLIGIGFCSADPFPEVEELLQQAKDSGRSASLGFTFTDPGLSTDLRRSFPWARSIIAVAHAYLPDAGNPGDAVPGTGRIARFATADHYRPLRAGLDRLATELRVAGWRAAVMCDDNGLVDRAAAVRSGIGWWGKSSMVLAPGVGPWILLGSVVTDAELRPDPPMVRGCGTCQACIPACPTGAIVAPGVVDSRRCIAAIVQSPGAIPIESRQAVGDRFYGCDECLTACPPGERLAATAPQGLGRVDLKEVLALDDRTLRARFPQFYVPRNDARFLRRNALVALGNTPDEGADLIVAGFLGHPDSLLRAHAAWALGRIGGAVAAAALRHRVPLEPEPEVVAEIEAALGTLA